MKYNWKRFVTIFLLPVVLFISTGCDSIKGLGSILVTPSVQALPINAPRTVPHASPTPAKTLVPTISPTPIPCNRMSAGIPIDITIPDGTHLRPGESFSKTWRVENTGSCTWNTGYEFIWFSGAQLSANLSQGLNFVVAPGDDVDITVDMTAPGHAGTYQSNWKLLAPDGSAFGLGPAGAAPLWVDIEVVDSRTPTPTALPTQTPTPQKLPGGKVILNLNDLIDLDSPQNTSSAPDLGLILSEQHTLELLPENNASVGVFGENLPGIKDCLVAEMSSAPISLEKLKDGIYLCYKTDTGMPGYARLTKIDLNKPNLNLEYYTWVIPDIKSTPQEITQ